MTTIAQLRTGMMTALDTISGLACFSYIQDNIVAPCAHVVPLDYDPREVMGETKFLYPFQIRFYAPRAAAEVNQVFLDTLREPSGSASVVAIVQDLTKWGGTSLDYASVTRVGEIGIVRVAEAEYLYLEVDVEVQI